MTNPANLEELVRQEIIQRGEEGCDVTGLAERLEQASTQDELMQAYHDLQALCVRDDFPYIEPSDLDAIRSARVAGVERRPLPPEAVLFDKIHGAWLGRIAGCMLGKPVEGWPKDVIKGYLRDIGGFPLAGYIPLVEEKLPKEVDHTAMRGSAWGTWKRALADDDTNYTALALKIMEHYGPDFTTSQVGAMWLASLPYNATCTAEHQAYKNLVDDLSAEEAPLYLNPYREWIGAQIRADFWGYCAPGWPEKAADLAYRDAALTHVKNGVYGEMFCAAAVSSALVTDDVGRIIADGLSVIPPKSRLAETVHDCLQWRKECSDWTEAFERMLGTYYGQYNWVHTNNNLAIVLIALLYGWPDFEKVITIAVMQGLDTDCNGATAGSIIGASLGAKALPDKWIEPLGGRLQTSIAGFPEAEIEDLARRTLDQTRRSLEPG